MTCLWALEVRNYISVFLKTSHVCPTFNGLETAWGQILVGPGDPAISRCRQVPNQTARPEHVALPMVSECGTMLLVAVKTAVTRCSPTPWVRTQRGSPVDDPSDAEVSVWSGFCCELWRPRIARSAVCSLTARCGPSRPGEGVPVSLLFR
jgi:hypothetical protein